jgi:hypothetical protein
MPGSYPTSYRRAGNGHLGFPRRSPYSEPAVDLAERRRALSAARMEQLVRQVSELDRRAGPVKGPLPGHVRPAWAVAEAAARAAHNPHWARALARAAVWTVRTSVRISPAGRVFDAIDLLTGPPIEMLEPLSAPVAAVAPGWSHNGGYKLNVQCSVATASNYARNTSGVICTGGWLATAGLNTTNEVGFNPTGQFVELDLVDWATRLSGNTYRHQGYQFWEKTRPDGQWKWSTGVAARRGLAGFNMDPLFGYQTQTRTTTSYGRSGGGRGSDVTTFTPRRPPESNVRERKAMTHGRGIRAIKRVVNAVTESMDVFNCLYEALPDSVKGYKPKPPIKGPDGRLYPQLTMGGEPAMIKPFRRQHTKAAILWANIDKIDVNKAIECAIKNHIEDKVLGTLASGAGPLGSSQGRPVGITAGPAL